MTILFETLGRLAADCGAEISQTGGEIVITNRENGNRLFIFPDCGDEYIVSFSTTHRHLDEPDDIADYVKEILSDEVLPIEFYLNGARRFGGELNRREAEGLSKAVLERQYCRFVGPLDAYEYEVKSWSGNYDTGRRPFTALP